LVVLTLNGLTLAQSVSAPLTVSSAAGVSVYLYNPATRTIVCPLDYSNELIMLPWQDFSSEMLWNVTAVGSVYYISAAFPSAAGCLGTNAFWNGVAGSLVSTLCATSETSASSFIFGVGARPTNYVIYEIVPGGNSDTQCVTIAGGVPTVPAVTCAVLTAATQWQLVTIG